MKNSTVEISLRELSTKIVSWDKKSVYDIIEALNDFEDLINDTSYDVSDFGINAHSIPTYKISKKYRESGICIAKDKNGLAIVGTGSPYSVARYQDVGEIVKKIEEDQVRECQ